MAYKNFSIESHGAGVVDAKLAEYKAKAVAPSLDILKKIHSCIDLTTLSNADNDKSVAALVDIVNTHSEKHPDIPNVAGICVYPKFVGLAKRLCKVPGVDIVSVAGAFPHAQTFTEIKVREVQLAVAAGADEIDVVITAGDILAKNYDAALDELKQMRTACAGRKMKVILETGVYKDDADIYDASIVAMMAGADFVKTSTGKSEPAATPRAALIMALAVSDYYKATGRRIGIKPAGGIRTSQDAMQYCAIMDDIFDGDYSNANFRLGATSLAKNVIADIKAL
ncbi:MAG: deoxyribose-phosphate aldolase [Bacteroidales bacterium]|nr:deoxyribose-phosphate aldolase [Bacteroidales bacterium]